MQSLTRPKKRVLDFITSYSRKNDISPSLEEICKGLGLKSVSTIHQHIEELKDSGHLKKESGRHRSIELPRREMMIEIPLLGTITAGQPIETIEIPDEMITITKDDIRRRGKHYALRVQGNSMIDDGIFDGDIVVIRQQQIADDGQTVVAVIDDNQATLKKIYREKNRFRLQPANQSMLPFY